MSGDQTIQQPAAPGGAPLPAGLEVYLGLGAEGLALDVAAGAVPTDLDPWLLDLCAVRLHDLGHRDRFPQPHDWEHLLPLLQPGEELLWIVDYVRGAEQPFVLRLALKANAGSVSSAGSLRVREERFRAIISGFQRQAFPESSVTRLSADESWAMVAGEDRGPTWCVTGIPSPKDMGIDQSDASRGAEQSTYQSLNDVVEAFLHVPAFRLTFVLGRCADALLAEEFGRVTRLRNHIHPLVKAQVAVAEQQALSWQQMTAEGQVAGSSRTETDSLWQRITRGLTTLATGSRESSRAAGFTWEEAPATLNRSTSHTLSKGTGGQVSTGRTVTTESLDSALELVDESLARYAQNLYAARASGAFRSACFIQAPATAAPVLAAAVRGVLSGTHSRDRPMTAFAVCGQPEGLLRSNRPTLDFLHPAVPVLTDLQACRMLLLPEAELPGLRLHRSVFLGRNATAEKGRGDGAQQSISLGHFAFSGDEEHAAQVTLSRDDLFRHMLVCGTTGSGKTRRVLAILNGMPAEDDELRVIVIETAKRTYRGSFCRDPARPPRVYTVGESVAAPLRINPFYFEPGTSLKRHVSVLSDALSELLPTESMIGPKLREAVELVYLDLGWDIETGTWTGRGAPAYPSPVRFVHAVRQIAESLTYGAEVSANYRGALEGRARVFLDATFQDIFSHDGDKDIEALFDRDTIIEMEGLPGSEIDVPAFILAILLERLRSHQQLHRRRRWLLVIEEAHNVLPRSAEESRSGQEADGAHTLVKNLVRLLQEGREMGIGVVIIDQAPTLLARSVLKNANTKVVMRLEDAEEIQEMGPALGLVEDAWTDLGVLRQGEAIIKAPYMAHPVKSAPYRAEELVFPAPNVSVPTAQGPAYARLEGAWGAVLRGAGPAPDAEWLDRMLGFGGASAAAVRFGLGRALLEAVGATGAQAWRPQLEGFDRLPQDPELLLDLARRWHARAQARLAAKALLPLIGRLLAAQAQMPWPQNAVSANAIPLASKILGGRPGGPSAETWAPLLTALSMDTPRHWKRLREPWSQVAQADAPDGPALRLLAACARLTEGPLVQEARRTPVDPLTLVRASRALVAQCLVDIDGLDPDRVDTLAHRVARIVLTGLQPDEARRLKPWLED